MAFIFISGRCALGEFLVGTFRKVPNGGLRVGISGALATGMERAFGGGGGYFLRLAPFFSSLCICVIHMI